MSALRFIHFTKRTFGIGSAIRVRVEVGLGLGLGLERDWLRHNRHVHLCLLPIPSPPAYHSYPYGYINAFSYAQSYLKLYTHPYPKSWPSLKSANPISIHQPCLFQAWMESVRTLHVMQSYFQKSINADVGLWSRIGSYVWSRIGSYVWSRIGSYVWSWSWSWLGLDNCGRGLPLAIFALIAFENALTLLVDVITSLHNPDADRNPNPNIAQT